MYLSVSGKAVVHFHQHMKLMRLHAILKLDVALMLLFIKIGSRLDQTFSSLYLFVIDRV